MAAGTTLEPVSEVREQATRCEKSEGAGAPRGAEWEAGAHLFLTRRSPSPGRGTGESCRRVTASLKFWLSLVTTSFFMELGMDEPWKSRK